MAAIAEMHTLLHQNSLPVSLLIDQPGLMGSFDAGASAVRNTRIEREEMVLEHLPLVRYVARSIHERLPKHVELDELVSAGMIGLVDAVMKFDKGRQVQFKSYAQFRIRGAILDSLRSLDWSPRELRRKGRALAEATRVLSARLGYTPSDAEVASEMGLKLIELQQLVGDLKGLEVASLNEEREETDEEIIAQVPAPMTNDPLFQCLEGQQRERMRAAIEELPEKERLVLTLYYFEELTMKEIGLTLGVVESRVSQIHSSALRKLKGTFGVAKRSYKPRQRRAAARG